jgi:hypothetical protein
MCNAVQCRRACVNEVPTTHLLAKMLPAMCVFTCTIRPKKNRIQGEDE